MKSRRRILEMEKRLADDKNGSYRDSVCNAFRQELQGVKREMDSGLEPDAFQQAGRYAAALETAVTVMDQTWRLDHGSA